jgi:hypothetical protein
MNFRNENMINKISMEPSNKNQLQGAKEDPKPKNRTGRENTMQLNKYCLKITSKVLQSATNVGKYLTFAVHLS